MELDNIEISNLVYAFVDFRLDFYEEGIETRPDQFDGLMKEIFHPILDIVPNFVIFLIFYLFSFALFIKIYQKLFSKLLDSTVFFTIIANYIIFSKLLIRSELLPEKAYK